MSLKRLNVDKIQAFFIFPKSSSSPNKHIIMSGHRLFMIRIKKQKLR